jgi:hypothetical protein
VVGPNGLTLGEVAQAPTVETAVRLAQWAGGGGGGGGGGIADLADVVRAHVDLAAEAARLNERRRRREAEAAAARRAQALLRDMAGLERVLERPVGVRAETPVACRLPGRADGEYVALLLGGNRRCLALCTDVLEPARRRCHWSVDLALVESIAVRQFPAAAAAAAAGDDEDADGGAGDDLTVTVRVKLPAADGGGGGGGGDGFRLTFSSSPVAGGGPPGRDGEEDGGGGGGRVELVLRRAVGGAAGGRFSLPRRGEDPSSSSAAVVSAAAAGVTADAVALEEFARELAEAVGAEEEKRRSVNDPRRSKLAEAMLEWPAAGRARGSGSSAGGGLR